MDIGAIACRFGIQANGLGAQVLAILRKMTSGMCVISDKVFASLPVVFGCCCCCIDFCPTCMCLLCPNCAWKLIYAVANMAALWSQLLLWLFIILLKSTPWFRDLMQKLFCPFFSIKPLRQFFFLLLLLQHLKTLILH